MLLNTWLPVDGAVLEDCGTFSVRTSLEELGSWEPASLGVLWPPELPFHSLLCDSDSGHSVILLLLLPCFPRLY